MSEWDWFDWITFVESWRPSFLRLTWCWMVTRLMVTQFPWIAYRKSILVKRHSKMPRLRLKTRIKSLLPLPARPFLSWWNNLRGKMLFSHSLASTTVTSFSFTSTTVTKTVAIAGEAQIKCLPLGWVVCYWTFQSIATQVNDILLIWIILKRAYHFWSQYF